VPSWVLYTLTPDLLTFDLAGGSFVSVPGWTSLTDLGNLVEALEDVAALGDATGRNQLVDLIDLQLRAEDQHARLNPDRPPNRRADLVAIVTAVLNRPRALPILAEAVGVLARGQPATAALRDLCGRVAQREPVLLDAAARLSLFDELAGLTPSRDMAALIAEATAPAPGPTSAGTLRAAVAELERLTSPMPLFRFLELVAACATRQDSAAALQQWIDTHLDLVPTGRRSELTALRRRLANTPAMSDDQPGLDIRMDPVDDERFSVLAWLSVSGSGAASNCGPEHEVTRAELRDWLSRLLNRHANTVRRARVGFILPASHLNEPVDSWEVTCGERTHRLGGQYQVVVRPDIRSAEGAERLAARWEVVSHHLDTNNVAGNVVERLASTSDAEVRARLDKEDWAWLAITCPMMGRDEAAVTAVMDIGTPIALWVRGDRDEADRRLVLDEVGSARQIDELPHTVWQFRKRGWAAAGDDVRRDLVLLWEDPTRPPPDGPTLVPPRPGGVATR
jgi:hypothetical protein